MKPLPKRILVKGLWVTVKEVPRSNKLLNPKREDDNEGACYPEKCLILIKADMDIQMRWVTLFHEWFHMYACGFLSLDVTEEQSVEAVTGELFGFLRYLKFL